MERNLLILILVLILGVPCLPGQEAPLPELPEVNPDDFPPVVREQVQEAYDGVRADPRDSNANGRLGMLLDLYKQRESAAVCYRRAHRLDPEAFRWLYYLGSLQILQGKRPEAVDSLRAATRLKPGDLPAGLKLAESLLAAAGLEEAAAMYESLVKQHPDAAEAYYGLGRIRAANNDSKGAVEFFSRACELFPSYGAAHYGLAQAYRKLGDSRKADEQLKLHATCKTLVPPVPDPLRDEMHALDRGAPSLVQRGIAFQDAGRLDDAIAEHEKALELDPEYVLAHANLVILYGRTRQPQKAEEHFRAAVRINPNFADSYYNYGVLLFNERNDAEAEEMFRKAVEINPFHAQALHNLGFMRERQGRLDEAMEFYRKAIERQPAYPVAHFNIGRILANRKEYDEAISHLLLALDPEGENTPTYLYALSATYARAGKREEALKYSHRAREQAASRGQEDLLRSIDRDLRALEKLPPR
jgi:tetratricopeptide (TPR) repeat protein